MDAKTKMPLGDPALFHRRCYANGAWTMGVNEGIVSNEVAPFGGVKESGIGREGSKHGMGDFIEIEYLCTGGIDGRAQR